MTDAPPTPSDEATYPVRFASPRRDSVVHARSAATGVLGWTEDLPADEAPQRELLVWNGQVLVVGLRTVALHGKDGHRLWERPHRPSSPVAVGNGNLYLETQAYFLQAVRPSNELSLDDAPLPCIGGNETFLALLWPRHDDFIVAATMPDPKFDSEDRGPEPKPFLSGCRARYGSRIGDWAEDYDGRLMLPPLFVPEKSRWVVSASHKVISVDVDTAEEKRFDLPIDEAKDWSADPAGVLAVTGMHKGKKVVLAVDVEGVEKWRFIDDAHAEPWVPGQPPIGAASGRLIVLMSHRVLAFDAGKLAWQFELPFESPSRATLLDDGSLLVTGGRTLRKVDASGVERFLVPLPAEIVSSPVVDAAGTIYVASASQLFSIH
jgi:outer membrane protein assembly factor BamB